MRLKILFLTLLILPLLWIGCDNNGDELSIFPEVTVTALNRTSISQGNTNNPEQRLEISFTVTDGNGDFGIASPLNNIFLTDNRDGKVLQFTVFEPTDGNPQIDQPYTVSVPNRPFNLCCMYSDQNFDDCQPHPTIATDTVVFTFQVRDFGGLVSPPVLIDPVIILCD